ncbi:MAG TPA: cupin domain-containing protein [Phycisphaerae bacterium]|nr:cupin domain-containing protein [Phycisphaerae bacterium]HNU45265.1 cupin domain-containing protein [Phycisphaerae bacterium]
MKVQAIESHPQQPVQMEGAQNVKMRMLIGRADGAANFHMRHFEVGVGGHTPHHAHPYEHEVLILSGNGVVRSPQGDRPIKAGDVVFVPADERHQFVNGGTGPLTFLCLIPAPQECA